MYSKFFTRLFLLIGMIGLFSISTFAQGGGEIVEIGQATTITTLAPIYTPHDYSVTQQLYTAEEIGTNGTITSIAFHWAYNGSKTYGIDVYMKHTDRTYFETTNDRIPLSASDKVFTGTISPSNDGWVTITLDTPFEYDGSNSLVIAVDRNSGSPGFSELDNNWNVIGTWYYTSTERYTMLYIGNSTDVDPFSPPYMTPSNYRPNIQIELASSVATCKAPKNFAASNVTNNSATLTWTAGSEDQSNWDVFLTQSYTDIPDENTTPTYQVTECAKALTGLTAQTQYYAYVRAACSNTDKSRWVSTNFTTTSEAYHVSANNSYETDFESSCDWVFTNGDLTNQWWWGNATNNGGQKAMYISNDNGASNAYTNNKAVVVYASKLFNFDQGTYTFVFDWKAYGESTYDYIRVALVPGDAELTASTSIPSVPSGNFSNNLPTGWIALDGGGKLNLQSNWQTKTSEVSVSGTYTMVFVWRDDTSTGTNPPAAIDNISISMLSCSKPTNLTANPNSIGSRTATLTWTAGGSETLWDIYLSTSSTAPNAQTTPTNSNIGSTSHTFNNLQTATTYYAWVRSNCGGGDVSSWSDVYSFSTTCEAYAIPHFFGFEDEASMNCFTKRSCANNTGRYNQNARTGSYCFRFFYNTNPPQYLIFPEMAGTENGVHVEFYYKKHSSGTEKFKVGYSTTDDATASFTWGEEITDATTTYQLFSMDYPAGTKFVGIQYTANNQYYLYIDDISLSEPPTCPKPTDFAASNVTTTTATLSWTETGTATNWVLQYGTDSNFGTYTEKTSGFSTNGNNISIGITNLTGDTQYYARVKSVKGSDESEWATCDFTTLPTCPAPTGLSATKTGTTITLNWTAGVAGQDAWDIRYKKSTDSEYTFIHLENQATTSYTITGLSPVTTYSVNVRAWCDKVDQSKWGYSASNQNLDLSVTTDCGAIELPYTCDFEGTMQTVNSCKIPSCWSVIKGYHNSTYSYGIPTVANQSSNTQPIAYPHGGTYCLYFLNSTYSGTSEEYAILPEISGEYNMKDIQIRFWVRSYSSSCTMEVGVMTDPSNANTYVQVEEVEMTSTYTEKTISLNSYTGKGRYIALKCPAASMYSQAFYVDDILVEYIPSCLVPEDLEADEIDVNEATLTWTPRGNETAWNVQYKRASDNEWSEPIAVEETSYTLTGLQRSTEYEVRVQANCDDDDQSDWTNPISFSTICGVWSIDEANALIEDFNGETFPPDCWQKVNFGEMGITNGWLQSFNNPLDNQGAVSSDFKHETWLFLPLMHLDGEAFLSFDHLFGSGDDYITSSVMITTDTDIDVEDIKTEGFITQHFTSIWTADASNLPSTSRNEVISLSGYDDEDVYIAFRYEGTYNYSGKIWYIDNVLVYVPVNQVIELHQGWNWFAPIANIDLEQLEQALGTNGISINSQNQFARYDEDDDEWSGDLTALVPGQMYKIQVSADCSFTLSGTPFASVIVNIEHGSNWFGYIGSEMTIEEAINVFTPAEGDKITSANGDFTIYEDNEWGGSLLNLEPGHGYIYISQDTETKQLTITRNH